MVILDVTIVNVAAPAIGRDLVASLTDLQWIVDGYTVAFAGLLLLGGALGDRWGHRRVFCLGVAVFTVSSARLRWSRETPSAHGVPPRSRAAAPPCWCPARWRCCSRSIATPSGPGAGLRAVGRDRGRRRHGRPAGRRRADQHGGLALGLRHQPARSACCASRSPWPRSGRPPRDRPGASSTRSGRRAVVVTVAALIAALNEVGPPGHQRARGHRRHRRHGRGRRRVRPARAVRRRTPAPAADGARRARSAAGPPSASCSTSASTA